MNSISVTAHGCQNSFARKVQHDPSAAIDLLNACKVIANDDRINAWLRANDPKAFDQVCYAIAKAESK